MKDKKNGEYEKFDDTMTQLLKVPHIEIKEKLEAEKTAKTKPPKKKKRPQATSVPGK
jgi:hypothetical protein